MTLESDDDDRDSDFDSVKFNYHSSAFLNQA